MFYPFSHISPSFRLRSPRGGGRGMLMSGIAETASERLYCCGLLPQSYACSQLNEMCPAAANYISRDEETFLLSILLKILPLCAQIASVRAAGGLLHLQNIACVLFPDHPSHHTDYYSPNVLHSLENTDKLNYLESNTPTLRWQNN